MSHRRRDVPGGLGLSLGLRLGAPRLGGGVADFASQWKTDNTGTSNNDQITLPLVASGTYNFTVDWGDGSSVDTITSHLDPAVTHTFLGGAGTYTVTITGQLDGWQFNNGGDADKITEVSNWGVLQFGSGTTGQFFGCQNMVVTATDSPDLSTAIDTQSMFRGCSSITTVDLSGSDTSNVVIMNSMFFSMSGLVTLNISGIDTSSVAQMSQLFRSCPLLVNPDVTFDTGLVTTMGNMFNGCNSITTLDVSGWDTSSLTTGDSLFRGTGVTQLAMDQAGWDVTGATNLTNMLLGVTLDTTNYDAILAAWAAQSPLQSGVVCSFGGSQYTIATSQANRDILTDPPNSWTLTDGGGV